MKKVISIILLMVILLSITACTKLTALKKTDGDFKYSVVNGQATITDYTGADSALIIPATLGGYPVTSIKIPNSVTHIGEDAFYYCDSLTSIKIPNSVTHIGEDAFYCCFRLTSITVDNANPNYSSQDGVLFNKNKTELIYYPNGNSRKQYTIPNSVKSIGIRAFSNCDSLTSIKIPNSVTHIGKDAFSNCDSLTSIEIPNSVTRIGEYAFAYCDSLTSITVDDANPKYSSQDGVLFNKDKTELICYPDGNSCKQYTIPNGVISIGNFAFNDCSNLTSIEIPNSVTHIGEDAFYCCNSLTSITVDDANPNYSSQDGVLFNKDKTELICHPDGNSRTQYTIPNTVTRIGNNAFDSCDITSIEIPNSVTSIGDWAFDYCDSLTSIKIPNSVTRIGEEAFDWCYSLTSITVDDANPNYSSQDGVLFNKDKTELICYPDGNSRTQYTIPNGVTSIGDSAFSNCDSLTSIKIPNSVTHIGEEAFWGCNSLKDVYYSGSETEWKQIDIDEDEGDLLNAAIHYNTTSM